MILISNSIDFRIQIFWFRLEVTGRILVNSCSEIKTIIVLNSIKLYRYHGVPILHKNMSSPFIGLKNRKTRPCSAVLLLKLLKCDLNKLQYGLGLIQQEIYNYCKGFKEGSIGRIGLSMSKKIIHKKCVTKLYLRSFLF